MREPSEEEIAEYAASRIPPELDRITDIVLAYRPKDKAKKPRKRKKARK